MIDKRCMYEIVGTFGCFGEVSDKAKHRIGRKGNFVQIEKNNVFKFVYDDESWLRSSLVIDIYKENENIIVKTQNTKYVFKKI